MRLIDPYEIGGNGGENHPLNIFPPHVYSKASFSLAWPETQSGGFYLGEEEIRLAADKFHEVIENRELVSQEPRAEIRLVSAWTQLCHEQAE
jgi:hypothetical protein